MSWKLQLHILIKLGVMAATFWVLKPLLFILQLQAQRVSLTSLARQGSHETQTWGWRTRRGTATHGTTGSQCRLI